jgi:NAD(P)-dependent dehydrogenase (short-subunit alcohol dehydrogenase family)
MDQLKNKTAFVIGGTAGIGLAVAQAYVQAGARVVIGGRRANGSEIAQGADCAFVNVDVGNEQSVQDGLDAAKKLVGALDILVINAGIPQPIATIETLDSEMAANVIDVDLLGVVRTLKHAPSHLADGGSVIITSSIAGAMGTPTESVYGAAKAGASLLARSAALELGPRGIRVNAVQPGPIETEMNTFPVELWTILAPLGRQGTVADLTGLYVLLASDASSYITGQVISVDGGLTAGTMPGVLRAVFGKVRRDAEKRLSAEAAK